METIWVLENVKKDKLFYNKLQLTLLVASISLWRRYHPDHSTVLYCDNLTYKTLDKLEILHLWHDIRELEYPNNIDREIFWSGCKTKIISETKIPIIVVDHDFLIRKNIDEHFNDKVLYSYDEIASNWYVEENCAFNANLTTPVERVIDLAANVSLFYLPDPKFANEYAKQTLQNHTEFTEMGIDNTNYMILSEQLMLKQMIYKNKIPYQTLNKNIWDCKKLKWLEDIDPKGIWNIKESSLYYKHYGVEKKRMKKEHFQYLLRCINSTKKNKWSLSSKWIK